MLFIKTTNGKLGISLKHETFKQNRTFGVEMIPWVVKAKYIKDYKVWLSFNDGIEGEADLSNELVGEIFEPLREISYFKNFKIVGHTLSWESGADFAPEFLREKLTKI